MVTTIVNILNYLGYRLIEIALRFDNISQYPVEEAKRYKKEDPYEMKVISFSLFEKSQVVDVGGYTGDWAQRIYGRYSCNIDIYEPHPELSEHCRLNFICNKKVNVMPYGLGNTTTNAILFGDNVHASVYQNNLVGNNTVSILKASDVFNKKYPHIELLKLNIEGAEYDVLSDLIQEYDMKKIDHILIQFHRNVPKYDQKRDEIRASLSKTHLMAWNYDYIFECWDVLPQ